MERRNLQLSKRLYKSTARVARHQTTLTINNASWTQSIKKSEGTSFADSNFKIGHSTHQLGYDELNDALSPSGFLQGARDSAPITDAKQKGVGIHLLSNSGAGLQDQPCVITVSSKPQKKVGIFEQIYGHNRRTYRFCD